MLDGVTVFGTHSLLEQHWTSVLVCCSNQSKILCEEQSHWREFIKISAYHFPDMIFLFFFLLSRTCKTTFFFFQLLGHVWFLLNFIELNYFGTNTTNFMFGAKKLNWMSKYGLTTKSSIVTKTYLRETFGIIFFSKLVCYPKPLNLNWILIYSNYFFM